MATGEQRADIATDSDEVAIVHRAIVQDILVMAGDYSEGPVDRVDEFTSFQVDLGMDSARAVEFLCAIEDRYGVELDEEEMVPILTVGEMITAVARVIRKQNPRRVRPARAGDGCSGRGAARET